MAGEGKDSSMIDARMDRCIISDSIILPQVGHPCIPSWIHGRNWFRERGRGREG